MSAIELDPAFFDSGTFDSTRFNVYTSKYINALSKLWRPLTRRIACWSGSRNATTGWTEPTFTDCTIYGHLVERGQQSSFLGVGVAVKLDATVKTMDGVFAGDQVFDPDSLKYYAVVEEPVETWEKGGYKDSTGAELIGFAFRTCHLRWLPYYRKGG